MSRCRLDGRHRGIAVGVIHPGNVASDILTPEELEHRRQTEGVLDAAAVARSVLLMATMPPDANVRKSQSAQWNSVLLTSNANAQLNFASCRRRSRS